MSDSNRNSQPNNHENPDEAKEKESSQEDLLDEAMARPTHQLSSISLKMFSDCVTLDKSNIKLSSIIHISKTNNQLNIEHNLVESSTASTPEDAPTCAASCPSTHPPPEVVVLQHHGSSFHSGASSVADEQLQHHHDLATGIVTTTESNADKATNTVGISGGRVPPPYTKNATVSRVAINRQTYQEVFAPNSGYRLGSGANLTAIPGRSQRLNIHPGIPPTHGAPPTYSAVMRIGGIMDQPSSRLFGFLTRRNEVRLQPSPPFIAPRPPPSYAEVQGVNVTRTSIEIAEEEIVWGPDPIQVLCPTCGNIILTSVHMHRSNLTHFSALALCICGCWPCCLLPYCIKTCKTTYHECPICFNIIGMFSPW